jgi:hypothetical protein
MRVEVLTIRFSRPRHLAISVLLPIAIDLALRSKTQGRV